VTQPNGIGQFAIGVSQIGEPPKFDFNKTVIAQYANSPIIYAMMQSFAEALDQSATMENFLDAIWDIETAFGYGLDLWGRIVGVSRVIPVRQGQFFGFHEAGDLNGGNFGSDNPFYQGQELTSNYYLSDSAFRLLIYAKAMANLSDCSIPSINQILQALFPNRGKAYVLDNQDMTMNYVFDFPLTPVEESIVYNPGVLPRPSGVLLNLQLLVLFNFLFPNVYPSPGLLQAHFDGLGNGLFETTVGGDTTAYTTTTTGNRIVIPAGNGGTAVTWIRAVWLTTVKLRWNGYMADLDPTQTLPGAKNYLANQQADLNNWSYGYGASFNIVASGGVVTSATPVGATTSSWDISTGTYTSKFAATGTQDATPNGIAFSADGTKLYVLGGTNKAVYQYTLSTAWDASTATYASKSVSVSAQASNPWGLTFSADGSKMYVTDQGTSSVYEYGLTTAWDVSTASYASKSMSTATQDSKPHGLAFDSTGTILYVAGYSSGTIYQYTLTTAYDVSTGTYSGKSLWTAGTSDTPGWLAFKPDGTKVMFTGAFSHIGMSYEWTLGTAWDISTGSSGSAVSFNLATQDATPTGFAVNPDGSTFYAAGTTNKRVYEYTFGSAVGGSGKGYAVGNIVPLNGGNNDAHLTVATVDANGAILTTSGLVGGTGYTTANGVTCNLAVNTKTETIVTLPQSIADATSVQVFYTYKNALPTIKGEALSGWPNLHSSISGKDYGTANDGDNYIAHALYYAYAVTSNAKYKNLADRIIAAQLSYGYDMGQKYSFDMPLEAQQATGLFYYANSPATWTWAVDPLPDNSGLVGLHVTTTVGAGSSGWGTWPVWPVTPTTPFSSISFDFWGDGSSNSIQLSTNIHDPSDAAGQYLYGYPCLPLNSGTKRTFTVTPTDFWQTNNVVLNTDRTNSYATASGDGTIAPTMLNQVEDNTGPSGYHRFQAKRFTFNVLSGGGTYAECYMGNNSASFSSAGTDRLKIDMNSSLATSVTVTIKDSALALFTYTYAMAAGAQVFNVLYSAFTPGTGIVHPIKEVRVKVSTAVDGYVDIDNVRCATATSDIVTMAAATVTLVNGLQFSFASSGSYNVYWKNVQINQTPINPYPGLSRWTYDFIQYGNYFGQGAWKGAQAPGYMWMGAYTLSNVKYPAGTLATYADGTSADLSNQPVITTMRQFMKDAQDAYAAQYPTATPGPFMKKYGTWAWEHTGGAGYIAGVAVPNGTHPWGILNQWYCEGSDDWYGYEYRAMLSIAEDYYYTGDTVSLGILNKIIAWMAAKCTFDGVHSVTCPTTFNIDGTLANSSNIYADAILAQICIYKYWRDGDATAGTWYIRFMDDLHYNHKITTTGVPAMAYVRNGGQNYSYATATLSDPTGTGVTAHAVVAGGKLSHVYFTGSVGTAYTNPTITIAGDGTGADVAAILSDRLLGAYAYEHTGWEVAEIGKMLGMLLHGRPGGPHNFTLASPSYLLTDYNDLWTYYLNNTSDLRPSIRNQKTVPMHEFTWSSWHWGDSLENPVNADGTMAGSRDTHTDGDVWTESIGPSLFFAADRYQASGDETWLDFLYELVSAMSGLTTYQ